MNSHSPPIQRYARHLARGAKPSVQVIQQDVKEDEAR